jgi:branched-chain amino acid transport system permease protein
MEFFSLRLTKINSLTISVAFILLIGFLGLTGDTARTGYLHAMIELMILSYSINLITGMAGYVNFGHIVFYGLGAYTVAVTVENLSRFGIFLPSPILVLIAGCFSALCAFILGGIVLRLRGDYFAIATLGVNEAVRVSIINTKELGEGRGIYVLRLVPEYDIKELYMYLLFILLILVLTSYLVLKSRLGYGIRAIKADEDVAEVMGVNTAKYKIIAYTMGAFFAGLTGGVVTLQFATAFPEYFAIVRSVDMLIAMMLGGAGTILGPLIGSIIFWSVKDALLLTFPYTYLLVFGTALILLVLFVPQGIVGVLNRFLTRRGLKFE